MALLYNLARVTTPTTGTGTLTLGGAVPGFLTFAQAGAQNGDVIAYAIRDGAQSEIGFGTYTASGTTLTRTVRKSTNADAAINLSGNAEVVITPSAEDGFSASAISFTPAGSIAATNVQAALVEVDGDITAHISDPTAAHAASAVSYDNATSTLTATQVQAALDELHQVGTWTPVLTFATPGDLSVAYSIQSGAYIRLGKLVIARFQVVTSAFTHTTASGDLRLTGLPFANGSLSSRGTLSWSGITKASYTYVVTAVSAAASLIFFPASGSGQAVSSVVAADVPTAGTVLLTGTLLYMTT